MRTQKNVNGITHASDTAEGWSVKIPTSCIDSVVKTLAFCQTLPQETEMAVKGRGKGKRGRKVVKPSEVVEVVTARSVGRPKGSSNKPKDTIPAVPKTKMIDVLNTLTSKGGPVHRDAVVAELKTSGFIGGPVAMFLSKQKWDGAGNYTPPN